MKTWLDSSSRSRSTGPPFDSPWRPRGAAGIAAAQTSAGAWCGELESFACARRERVDKLAVIRQEVDERILEPIHCRDRGDYLGALDRDPAATWPAVVEQLIATERDAARSGTKGVA